MNACKTSLDRQSDEVITGTAITGTWDSTAHKNARPRCGSEAGLEGRCARGGEGEMRRVVTALNQALLKRLRYHRRFEDLHACGHCQMSSEVIYNRRKPVLILGIIVGVNVLKLRCVRYLLDMRKMYMEKIARMEIILLVLVDMHKGRLQERERQRDTCQNGDPCPHTTIVHGRSFAPKLHGICFQSSTRRSIRSCD
jgi:hypothetical protein